MHATTGGRSASLGPLEWQPKTERWRLRWPAGPTGHCRRAAGHMLGVPSDPGQPSGLGCVPRAGSKCPYDPSQQPVEKDARFKSHNPTGPCPSLLHFGESLGPKTGLVEMEDTGYLSRFPLIPGHLGGSDG